MLMRKDRKIPSSVYKPHAEFVISVVSAFQMRVFFPYPKYCDTLGGNQQFVSTATPMVSNP